MYHQTDKVYIAYLRTIGRYDEAAVVSSLMSCLFARRTPKGDPKGRVSEQNNSFERLSSDLKANLKRCRGWVLPSQIPLWGRSNSFACLLAFVCRSLYPCSSWTHLVRFRFICTLWFTVSFPSFMDHGHALDLFLCQAAQKLSLVVDDEDSHSRSRIIPISSHGLLTTLGLVPTPMPYYAQSSY